MTIVTHSPQETHHLATTILDKLKGYNVIALYGQLGSGKTTFIQGLAKELGITKRILSPSFIIMREYRLPPGALYNSMFHLDLYRVQSAQDLKSIDLEEILSDSKNLVVIEWAEKAKGFLPKRRLNLYFTFLSETSRKISLVASG